jgi:hypothetical protein
MSIKHDIYMEKKTTMANGDKKVQTWSIKNANNTIIRSSGLLGDESKTKVLKEKIFKTEAGAKNFFKAQVASRLEDGFKKKKSVSTPPKGNKKKRKTKASDDDGKKAKKSKKSKKEEEEAEEEAEDAILGADVADVAEEEAKEDATEESSE